MAGKLSPRYICATSWRGGLQELLRVRNVFHVSQLHKYIQDPSHVIELDPIHHQEDLSYEEQPIRILYLREKQLHRKTVPLVKVL